MKQFAFKASALEARAEENRNGDGEAHGERMNSKTPDIRSTWDKIATRLRAELGEDLYSSWFARMEPVELTGDTLTVSVPTKFLQSWIQSHYLDRVIKICRHELKAVRNLDIRVRTRGVPAHQTSGKQPSAHRNEPSSKYPAPQQTSRKSQGSAANDGWLNKGTLPDPGMTFDSFIKGKSNALAYAAAQRIAETQLGMPLSFNPLYLHSPAGFGKTHLLNAITWSVKSMMPERRVFFLSAERFMYYFVSALQNRDMIAFKDFFRTIDVLLIDDFQFLQGRSMQQEFCHTFTSLVDSHRQVIVAADTPPAQLDSIDGRMRSRLAGGLVVDIEPAEFELRLAILQARIASAVRRDASFGLSDDIVEFIAQRIQGGGRELDGALKRVWAHQQLVQAPITIELAELAIRDLIHAVKNRRISIDDILREIGRHFSVAKSDLLSPRRARSIVRPRQIGMYLAKQLTTRSLPEIGRRFGGRDHSTVLHAIRKINDLMEKDDELVKEIGELTRKLQK